VLLGLWKTIKNLLLEGLNLFHQTVSLGWMGHCVGTIIGEETISDVSSTICFLWIEGVEAMVVAVVFCTSFEHTVNRMNFGV
jgi:hypothetical protein